MLIAPIIYEFRAAGLVELVPTCQVSPVNPTPSASSAASHWGCCSQPGAPCLQQCLGSCSYTEVTQGVTAAVGWCLCRGGCGSLGKPKSIPNEFLVLPKSGSSLCSLHQPQVAVQGELGLGRELLLLSVTTGHSLHMHSIIATIKHKIIESSDWKKIPQIYSKVGYSGQTDCTQSLERHLQS